MRTGNFFHSKGYLTTSLNKTVSTVSFRGNLRSSVILLFDKPMPKKSPFNFNFYKGQYFRSLVSFQLSPTFRFMVGVDFHSCFLFKHFKIVYIWRQRALLYPHPNTSRIKKEEEGAVLFLFSSVSVFLLHGICFFDLTLWLWILGFFTWTGQFVKLWLCFFLFWSWIYVMFVFSILLWDFCSAF